MCQPPNELHNQINVDGGVIKGRERARHPFAIMTISLADLVVVELAVGWLLRHFALRFLRLLVRHGRRILAVAPVVAASSEAFAAAEALATAEAAVVASTEAAAIAAALAVAALVLHVRGPLAGLELARPFGIRAHVVARDLKHLLEMVHGDGVRAPRHADARRRNPIVAIQGLVVDHFEPARWHRLGRRRGCRRRRSLVGAWWSEGSGIEPLEGSGREIRHELVERNGRAVRGEAVE